MLLRVATTNRKFIGWNYNHVGLRLITPIVVVFATHPKFGSRSANACSSRKPWWSQWMQLNSSRHLSAWIELATNTQWKKSNTRTDHEIREGRRRFPSWLYNACTHELDRQVGHQPLQYTGIIMPPANVRRQPMDRCKIHWNAPNHWHSSSLVSEPFLH